MEQRVHQVVFSDKGPVALTGYSQSAAQSVQSVFSDHHYRCWSLQDARQFIDTHFPPSVRETFETLVPFAYKADLFKYCLLKVLGGWYVDIGVTVLKNPLVYCRELEPGPEFVLFRATGPWDPPWACSVALIYAAPGHAVFDTAIEQVVTNCRQRRYGTNPVMPTMEPFGAAIAHHRIHATARVGNVVDVRWRSFRRAYELKPGEWVARRKPRRAKAGDISGIGVAGANNYVALWHERRIYGERSGAP